MYSVILCGGSGTRLWPLSRKNYPKQFLKLVGEHSLLQETYVRMRAFLPSGQILFVTNQDNYFNVLNQIRDIEPDFDQSQVIQEPKSLNTAPAMAYAIKYLLTQKHAAPDEKILFLPADHYIKDIDAYAALLRTAFDSVGEHIGTIGIRPTRPETGYGYIRKGEKQGAYFQVAEFCEKPDRAAAERYVDSGEYVWNAGMYLFSIAAFAREAAVHAPEIAALMQEEWEAFSEKFPALSAVSFDYAVSEKSDRMVVFEGDFGWNDIGSFDSLADAFGSDPAARQIGIDSKNVFVYGGGERLIATIGMEDIVVVDGGDSLLIHKRGRAEEVKQVVEILKEQQAKEIEYNLVGYRPWGKYEVLMDRPGYKVKRIKVYPGAKLSLQAHNKRSEHWVVVSGMARIVNGDKDNPVFLKENESTFVPANTVHRIENPGKINLEIIEVQTGSYLGEDDIIRYDDEYKRA
ncbi:MAG: mannose-1-phosphate guanylyltransferase/mannose-6-phosphate isomerase [Candidatus Moranbacteria bacterium RIFCSPHIGHO2_12_FULL_54_9]|nr:MAG: mannose-1-phosphate guanylyltransferase/mannose-6-phosphate isomerase [Candidatus Moranbacteria bacterium RIFCSPHIGHO2_01_FULL_54_31]OGI24556.1 MAG: mannose-1-phosphate guanylyltransferase/mannose-6-phosphate isomerase [Candidatus Moranbacteria bacterium RIFCSPHIGHO2_12_FULL_54_9]